MFTKNVRRFFQYGARAVRLRVGAVAATSLWSVPPTQADEMVASMMAPCLPFTRRFTQSTACSAGRSAVAKPHPGPLDDDLLAKRKMQLSVLAPALATHLKLLVKLSAFGADALRHIEVLLPKLQTHDFEPLTSADKDFWCSQKDTLLALKALLPEEEWHVHALIDLATCLADRDARRPDADAKLQVAERAADQVFMQYFAALALSAAGIRPPF